MNIILRNFAAVVAGIIVGGVINMALIMIGNALIPLPAGVDPANVDSYAASMHLLNWHHFITPFAAHAVGTLVGAIAAASIGVSRQLLLAMIIGVFFLIGGIFACFLIPAPVWFMVIDLVLAYIPMAWLGWKLGNRA